MATHHELIEKVRSRDAKIGVIGLGYVGLPLLLEFAGAGFHATGFERDPARVERLKSGVSYVPDIPSSELKKAADEGRLSFETGPDGFKNMDSLHICVPTPLVKTKDPDLSYIISVVDDIAERLRPGQMIVLESTTYPGTTEEVALPILQKTGMKAGTDFFLAFSPERVDPGNTEYSIRNTPKVVGGITDNCLRLATEVYSTIVNDVVSVSSTRSAEMVKILENTFRAINIGLANETAMICGKLGISVWEVIDAAATKPFGFKPFYPGPGLGGHCIPVDPHYLAWKMRNLNFRAKFIELAEEINTAMPQFVVSRTANALNERQKSLSGSKILLLGITYKKNINDIRESPALVIIDLLMGNGVDVSFNDPCLPADHKYNNIQNTELAASALNGTDCVIICTDHDQYDYQWIVDESSLIIDCRNATKGILGREGKIVRL